MKQGGAVRGRVGLRWCSVVVGVGVLVGGRVISGKSSRGRKFGFGTSLGLRWEARKILIGFGTTIARASVGWMSELWAGLDSSMDRGMGGFESVW